MLGPGLVRVESPEKGGLPTGHFVAGASKIRLTTFMVDIPTISWVLAGKESTHTLGRQRQNSFHTG